MADIETKLRLTAVDQTQNAFRQAAQSIEAFQQKTSRANKQLVVESKGATSAIGAVGAAAKMSFASLAGLASAAAAAGLIKESVSAWSEQEKALLQVGLQANRTRAEMKGLDSEIDDLAQATGRSADDLTKNFERLSKAHGFEAARDILKEIATVGTATGASLDDVATAATGMVKALKIDPKNLRAAFDAIDFGEKNSRVGRGDMLKYLGQLAPLMDQIGQTGQAGINRTVALLGTMAGKTATAEEAFQGLSAIMDGIGSKRVEGGFAAAGIDISRSLEAARKNGKDVIAVYLKATDEALLNLARRQGLDPARRRELLSTLFQRPEIRHAMNDVLSDTEGFLRRFDQLNAGAARGSIDRGFGVMSRSLAVELSRLSEAWKDTKETLGELVAPAALVGIQALTSVLKGAADAMQALMRGAAMIDRGDFSGLTRHFGDASKQPPKAWPARPGRPGGGGWKPMSGNADDIGAPSFGTRPMIPTAPGTASEATMRAILGAIERLEAEQRRGGSGDGATPRFGGGGGTGGAARARGQRAILGGRAGGYGGSMSGKMAEIIREEAVKAGVDPNVMLGIYAGEGRGGYTGDKGSSFGPFQLHYGGVAGGGNAGSGMGDEFTRETGLNARDPSTVRQQAAWVAKRLRSNPGLIKNFHGYQGPWRGGGATPAAGGANFMNGQYGAPGENLTTIHTEAGPVTVNRAAAPHFQAFFNDLKAAGAPITSLGGYNNRNIAGSGRKSQHAYGNAVDTNMSGRNRVSPALQQWYATHGDELNALESKHGIIGGEHWKNPDTGHFEWGGKTSSLSDQYLDEVNAIRRKASQPIRTKIAFDVDTPGIRDRGEAQSRRALQRDIRRGTNHSYTDVGVC